MFLVTVISATVILIDILSKMIVESNAAYHVVTVIPGFFQIYYAENTGMAWSLLSGQQAFLSMAAAIAIGVMIWYLLKKKPDFWTRISLALMIGGAAGNLFDRLFLGYVRDFLSFNIFGYDFPIFNVADTALTIGVIFLFLVSLKDEKKVNE